MLTQMVGGRVFDYSHQVGGREMLGDVALALGEGDDVYTLVRQAYLIGVLRLTIGSTPGDEEIVGMFGKRGDGDGGFVWPTGIAVDSDYNVYVTDEWLNRVTVFSQDGAYLGHWGESRLWRGAAQGPVRHRLRCQRRPVYRRLPERPRAEVHGRRRLPRRVGKLRQRPGRARPAVGPRGGWRRERLCRRSQEPPRAEVRPRRRLPDGVRVVRQRQGRAQPPVQRSRGPRRRRVRVRLGQLPRADIRARRRVPHQPDRQRPNAVEVVPGDDRRQRRRDEGAPPRRHHWSPSGGWPCRAISSSTRPGLA